MKTDIIKGTREEVFNAIKDKMSNEEMLIVNISYFYDLYAETHSAIITYYE